MRRLNLSQAGSCDVMLILASPSTAAVPRESKPALREFADSCGNTAPTEWQQRRSVTSVRGPHVFRTSSYSQCNAKASAPSILPSAREHRGVVDDLSCTQGER